MKKINKIFMYSFILALPGLTGCSLDDVLEKGDKCPKTSDGASNELNYFVYFDEASGTVAKCSAGEDCYTKNVIAGHCPIKQQYCHVDSSSNYCSECGEDLLLCGKSLCINPQTDSQYCGASGLCNDDSETSVNYRGTVCKSNETCKNGVCIADACSDTSHVYNGQCEDDSVEHCGSHDTDCSTNNGWKTGNCVSKKCVAETCTNGYHLDSTGTHPVCKADSATACGPEATDCTKTDGWEDGKCVSGQCQAIVCTSEYHLHDGMCVSNNLEQCGGHTNCYELQGWKAGECIDGQCVANQCQVGYHISETVEGGFQTVIQCVADDYNSCGTNLADCTTLSGWQYGSCEEGKCKALMCQKGYHLRDDECVKDDLKHCGSHASQANCTNLSGWKEGNCTAGRCYANQCQTGYHIEETLEGVEKTKVSQCVSDTTKSCGTTMKDCEVLPGWKQGNCVDGKCSAIMCLDNYHLNENECVHDDIEHCGGHDEMFNCTLLEGWDDGECILGKCNANKCISEYHVAEKKIEESNPEESNPVPETNEPQYICELDTELVCGREKTDCTSLDGYLSGECQSGTCIIKECKEGYHIYNNTCYKDDESHCGGHEEENNCTRLDGWKSGICENRECIATSCLDNYFFNNGACSKNDTANCGSKGYNCATKVEGWSTGTCSSEGKCVVSTCKSTYHIYSGSCEKNNDDNCGRHGMSCYKNIPSGAESATCTSVNGTYQCLPSTCKSGYHMYYLSPKICEANSTSNCGAHNSMCSTSSKTGSTAVTCVTSTGICNATSCGSNYHLYTYTSSGKSYSSCEVNSNSNCRAHGVTCSTSNIANSSAVSCSSGTCVATSCKSGYHLYNNACEEDNAEHCGASRKNCNYLWFLLSGAFCIEGVCCSGAGVCY